MYGRKLEDRKSEGVVMERTGRMVYHFKRPWKDDYVEILLHQYCDRNKKPSWIGEFKHHLKASEGYHWNHLMILKRRSSWNFLLKSNLFHCSHVEQLGLIRNKLMYNQVFVRWEYDEGLEIYPALLEMDVESSLISLQRPCNMKPDNKRTWAGFRIYYRRKWNLRRAFGTHWSYKKLCCISTKETPTLSAPNPETRPLHSERSDR